MYTLFYVRKNTESGKWEVRREDYLNIASEIPLGGSNKLVTARDNEKDANIEARRQQRMLHA